MGWLAGAFVPCKLSVQFWRMRVKMAASQSPPHSSVSPQRKAVNHSCLPGLRPHSVLTRPMTERFCLWHPTPGGISKPSRSLWCAPAPLLPGEEGESPQICRLLCPCWRSSGLTVLRIMVYGNPELRARASAPSLQPASLLRYLGALPHSGTPSLSVTPRVLRPHCPTRVPPPA